MNNLTHHWDDREYNNNDVIWKRTAYQLIDCTPAEAGIIIDPCDYGMTPMAICRQCQTGFYCTYHVANDALLLTKLNILTLDGQFSEIDGKTPIFCNDDHSWEYQRLRHFVRFTGIMRIQENMSEAKRKRLWNTGYRSQLWDLSFIDGRLESVVNRLDLVETQLKAQRKIRNFIANHNLDSKRTRELIRLCNNINDKDWKIADFDYTCTRFHALQPDVLLAALGQVQKARGKPYWFIANYGDSGLGCGLTFKYLQALGLPAQLLNFCKEFVSDTITERMVVLEFIESMRLTIAADCWEERVTPGHLYTDAHIPVELTTAIRKRLVGITLNSWKV